MSGSWNPERIKALRKSLGLTQEQFARRLRKSEGTVHRYEKGLTHPSSLAVEDLEMMVEVEERKSIPW